MRPGEIKHGSAILRTLMIMVTSRSVPVSSGACVL